MVQEYTYSRSDKKREDKKMKLYQVYKKWMEKESWGIKITIVDDKKHKKFLLIYITIVIAMMMFTFYIEYCK